MKEALFYKKLDGNKTHCLLCPKSCIIEEQGFGFCGVRQNNSGRLYSTIYNKTTGIALDPIEKKPLYHFHPHELILSLGTRGCNLACVFCQNWHISQAKDAHLEDITSLDIIGEAKRLNSFGIAYTYNEPLIWYEFVFDTAKLAKEKGLKNVLVTNGYINPEPLEDLLPYIDGMNIDLKAMDNEFYKNICKGTLTPVLDTIARAKQNCHIELTNLLIPGLNDSDEHIENLTAWIFENTSADTPLHFSRYFPRFKLDLPSTPLDTLKRAESIARKKLKHVYLGNA
ncbi:MAG: AmmeMemoRadiSam system radical SAM enzyme [Candidatus Omnitrophica bacterium]|nr:AmmeMemoRadiSam system radical SAM enzyme [Candidatus Omnitrophota bacterium]MBU1925299.1 AmmeMemoRadiSam system radical SAM enzyme [Candidatus Omnitrophota bacterium]